MNTILNENWQELGRELAPAIGEAASKIGMSMVTNLYENVPFDELFPQTVYKA